MKIATWNVNSIRTRLDHVLRWLEHHPVEILCLQETKVIDEIFPRSSFEDLGYHVSVYGQKAYNGVAILSQIPPQEVMGGFSPILGTETVGEFDQQKRLLAANLGDFRVISVYVPNGGELGSDKYYYKLKWLKLLKKYLEFSLSENPHLCICGDFNIVPDDRDIYDDKIGQEIVGLSEPEREELRDILALGLADPFRKFTREGGHFSWWDYRGGSFPKNRGWRIDHHYLSSSLYDQAKSCVIDKEPRLWEKPSDHTPVILEL